MDKSIGERLADTAAIYKGVVYAVDGVAMRSPLAGTVLELRLHLEAAEVRRFVGKFDEPKKVKPKPPYMVTVRCDKELETLLKQADLGMSMNAWFCQLALKELKK